MRGFEMSVVYETERLILRVFQMEDVESVKTFWGDEEVMVHCLGATPHEKLPLVLQAYIRSQEETGLSVYAVVEKSTGQVVGASGFNIEGSNVSEAELIYHFARSSWGSGYATEAALASISVARSHGEVRRLYASADPEHSASHRVLEKLGFICIGMQWFDDAKREEPVYELKLWGEEPGI